MSADLLALVLALVTLSIGLIAPKRDREQIRALMLLPTGIVIGVLPRIFHLSDPWKIAGSATSILLSVTAIVLMIRAKLRRTP